MPMSVNGSTVVGMCICQWAMIADLVDAQANVERFIINAISFDSCRVVEIILGAIMATGGTA